MDSYQCPLCHKIQANGTESRDGQCVRRFNCSECGGFQVDELIVDCKRLLPTKFLCAVNECRVVTSGVPFIKQDDCNHEPFVVANLGRTEVQLKHFPETLRQKLHKLLQFFVRRSTKQIGSPVTVDAKSGKYLSYASTDEEYRFVCFLRSNSHSQSQIEWVCEPKSTSSVHN